MKITSAYLQLVPSQAVPFSTLKPEQEIIDRRVKKIIRLMREDLSQPISLASIAIVAAISPRQLSRLFKMETGFSPMQYLHLLRFEGACFLLGSSCFPIKEICHQVGLEDGCNFTHEFKKLRGCSPREFRRKMTML